MERKNNWILGRGTMKYDNRANIVQLSRLWQIRVSFADARDGKHDIYWGCHACDLDIGHVRKCVCKCGARPTENSMFWGKDFKGFTEVQKRKRGMGLSKEDGRMTEVIGKLEDTIINGHYQRSVRLTTKRISRSRKLKKKKSAGK